MLLKYASSSLSNLFKHSSKLLIAKCGFTSNEFKLINCYDNSLDYIKGLLAEKSHLNSLIASETYLSSNYANKSEIAKKLNNLNKIEVLNESIAKCVSDLKELQDTLTSLQQSSNEDDEFKQLLLEDITKVTDMMNKNKIRMIDLLIPDEDMDTDSVIMELSAGVGGNESRIFCSELFEMYKKYSAIKSWTYTPIKTYSDVIEMGEMMRQANIEISGENVYKYLKFEAGVHRVQRVPKTEAKAVGVVVTPKPKKIEIELNPKELKIETKNTSGPGGQHVNKTESAIRITHLPTGIVVYCDEERKQLQNRTRAMNYLKQKLYQMAYEEQLAKRQANRKMQVGTSSRSERIRTYNYLQDRITDHRLNTNFHSVPRFLSAENLDDMIEMLMNEQKAELMHELLSKKAE